MSAYAIYPKVQNESCRTTIGMIDKVMDDEG
jgi:hypothetical protein